MKKDCYTFDPVIQRIFDDDPGRNMKKFLDKQVETVLESENKSQPVRGKPNVKSSK